MEEGHAMLSDTPLDLRTILWGQRSDAQSYSEHPDSKMNSAWRRIHGTYQQQCRAKR
jgi:hypothetical protein